MSEMNWKASPIALTRIVLTPVRPRKYSEAMDEYNLQQQFIMVIDKVGKLSWTPAQQLWTRNTGE